MSLAYRIAQPADNGTSEFTWSFLGAGEPTDSSTCAGFGTPDACCTGVGTGSCPYSPFLATGGITSIANVDLEAPIEVDSSLCTPDSTTLTAPSITTTEADAMGVLVFGIVGDNSISKPAGYSGIYQHNISGTGPGIANYTQVFATSGTVTGNAPSSGNAAGDNLGYQLGLSPRLP
jgi:hypothetical protein